MQMETIISIAVGVIGCVIFLLVILRLKKKTIPDYKSYNKYNNNNHYTYVDNTNDDGGGGGGNGDGDGNNDDAVDVDDDDDKGGPARGVVMIMIID